MHQSGFTSTCMFTGPPSTGLALVLVQLPLLPRPCVLWRSPQVPHSRAGPVGGLLVTPHTPHTWFGGDTGTCSCPAAGTRHTGCGPWSHSSCQCWVPHTPHSCLPHLLVAVFGGTHHSYQSGWVQDPHSHQLVAQRPCWLQWVTPQVRQGCPYTLVQIPSLVSSEVAP